MSFEKLGLSAEILRAITKQGYTTPTAIQKQAIPLILEGRDLMAGSQTGTGKTAAFTLPLLHHLNTIPQQTTKRVVRALILTPTRELAAQVHNSVCQYGHYLHLKSTAVFGGVNIFHQTRKLNRGVDILIATPGRLLDHVRQNNLDLSKVEMLVLDEADRMLDMGFLPDVRRILSLLPKQRQNLLFSATFSKEVKKLANSLLKSPALIEATQRNTTASTIAQKIHPVDQTRKRELLSFLIGSKNWRQILVFTRTKHGANRLSQQLEKDGLSAAAIHGDKSQGARTKALENFKKGAVRVLVATDIASRGLDIDQLPHVVNFELPLVPEDYIHRIGRTGRAGLAGEAISLVCGAEFKLLKEIERLLKTKLPQEIVPDYEPDPSVKSKPIDQRKSSKNRKKSNSNAKSKPKFQERGKKAKTNKYNNKHKATKRSASRGQDNNKKHK